MKKKEKKHFVFRHNFQNRLLFIFNRFCIPFCCFTSNLMFSAMFSLKKFLMWYTHPQIPFFGSRKNSLLHFYADFKIYYLVILLVSRLETLPLRRVPCGTAFCERNNHSFRRKTEKGSFSGCLKTKWRRFVECFAEYYSVKTAFKSSERMFWHFEFEFSKNLSKWIEFELFWEHLKVSSRLATELECCRIWDTIKDSKLIVKNASIKASFLMGCCEKAFESWKALIGDWTFFSKEVMRSFFKIVQWNCQVKTCLSNEFQHSKLYDFSSHFTKFHDSSANHELECFGDFCKI